MKHTHSLPPSMISRLCENVEVKKLFKCECVCECVAVVVYLPVHVVRECVQSMHDNCRELTINP